MPTTLPSGVACQSLHISGVWRPLCGPQGLRCRVNATAAELAPHDSTRLVLCPAVPLLPKPCWGNQEPCAEGWHTGMRHPSSKPTRALKGYLQKCRAILELWGHAGKDSVKDPGRGSTRPGCSPSTTWETAWPSGRSVILGSSFCFVSFEHFLIYVARLRNFTFCFPFNNKFLLLVISFLLLLYAITKKLKEAIRCIMFCLEMFPASCPHSPALLSAKPLGLGAGSRALCLFCHG